MGPKFLDKAILSLWTEPNDCDMHVEWTRRFSEAVRPFASGAVYVNNLGDKGDERVRSAYGPSEYERLVLLKNTYDPDNVFRLNQNIRPTARQGCWQSPGGRHTARVAHCLHGRTPDRAGSAP